MPYGDNKRIAIEKESREGFTFRYIEYCQKNHIDYILVDSTRNDFVSQIKQCNAFLWHPNQNDHSRMLYATSLTLTLENCGIQVFPNSNTIFHFDDKPAETRLLQMMDAPIVKSYVFYNKDEAIQWAQNTEYPKVFKLRGGAGSTNVLLVHSKRHALKLINKMFSTGINASGKVSLLKDHIKKFLHKKSTLHTVGSRFKAVLLEKFSRHFVRREFGYAFFQDFIPNNDSDMRVIVIDNKAFAIRRMCRPNDFRASGSGTIVFAKAALNEECVRISFDVAKKLKTQCLAFDYVMDHGKPLIVEISYGFAMKAYDSCEGYWTDDMIWHDGPFNPQEWIIDNLIAEL